ncbi:phage antirepressor KilAC domain-containing protein [Companilactobacillus mishanensis]|uniref:phage antirepressor KilAC domain-containing protein n=1 Tax=Companilactobacillus mishanensis TaxID=2486008 RepID=UPI00129525E6|nr:phage antirepressor KilAC domain-containing protein [Companilactobacillus mishanensis]MQS88251.1 phage antirepressor Ant [Companilactobacillus mishanensis]
MNNLQEFTNGDIKLPVRTNENGDIEFDAEKSAIGLGIVDTSKGTTKVRWARLNSYLSSAKSGARISKGDFITEPQFYKLAIKANNATAEKFQDWVTSEVLPTIRKYGAYMTDQKAYDITHNKDSLADLLLQAGEQLKRKDAQITEMKPKAMFADSVATSHTTILVGDLAKIIKGNGVDTGARRLFQWMRDNGYLIKRKGADYNSPTQKSMEMGLFKIKESSHVNGDGVTVVTKTPKVTGKGQQYFVNKFLADQQLKIL